MAAGQLMWTFSILLGYCNTAFLDCFPSLRLILRFLHMKPPTVPLGTPPNWNEKKLNILFSHRTNQRATSPLNITVSCISHKLPGNMPVKGLDLEARTKAPFAIEGEDRGDGHETCQSRFEAVADRGDACGFP